MLLIGSLKLVAEANPFAETVLIETQPREQGDRVFVHVFDRRGRLCRCLGDGMTVGQSLGGIWDGRDDKGVLVRPGHYVVMMEFSDNYRIVDLSRTLVTFAKGL